MNAIVENRGQVLWALQEPVSLDSKDSDKAMEMNTRIDLYNRAAMEVQCYTILMALTLNVHY